MRERQSGRDDGEWGSGRSAGEWGSKRGNEEQGDGGGGGIRIGHTGVVIGRRDWGERIGGWDGGGEW